MKQNSSKLSDDAPLLAALDKNINEMSSAELQQFVKEMQEASSNVQATKSRLTKKKTAKKKSKPDASSIASKYI